MKVINKLKKDSEKNRNSYFYHVNKILIKNYIVILEK